MEGSCTWTLVWPAPVSGWSDCACHPRGYSGFQVTRMIEWGQKSKPKKIPGPNFNPQKSHAKFLSHKNFQKAETVAKQVWFYTLFAKLTWPGMCGNYHESSDSFQYPPKSLLKSGYSSYPEKSQNQTVLLEIWSTVCTPPGPITSTFCISDSERHAGEVLKTLKFHYIPKVDNKLSLLQTKAMFKILEINYKETFYAFRRTK